MLIASFLTFSFASLDERTNLSGKYSIGSDIHTFSSFEVFSQQTKDLIDEILKDINKRYNLTVDDVFALLSVGLGSYHEYKVFIIDVVSNFF